jgi:diadenosine tetraphosphate (Ap4A) HIT family hydrolase
LFDVPYADHALLWAEMRLCHETLKKLTNAEKMNVGALGNMVPQLHIHLIARQAQDAAWPKPVWGVSPAVPYTDEAAESLIARLLAALSGEDEDGLDNGTALA